MYLENLEIENKTGKFGGSTMPASLNPQIKPKEEENSIFPDTLMEIQEDQQEINFTSLEHKSIVENKFTNKVLNNFVSPVSGWLVSGTNQRKLKSEFSPEEKICEFEHE